MHGPLRLVDTERHPLGSRVSGAGEAPSILIDGDRVNQGEAAVALRQSNHVVFLADLGTNILWDASLTVNRISLAVEARRQNGIGNRHAEVNSIQNDRSHGSNDARRPRRTDHEDRSVVL